MALSIGSQILEAIRQRKLQGNDPDSPMSERLPSGDNSIDVAREPLPPLTGDYNTMTRNLAPPSEFDRPVRGVPLSDDSSLRSVDMARGMPVQDHSGTQFLQTPPSINQLDSSNLAGPVPTTLNGPSGESGPTISNADGSMLGLTGTIPAQQAATAVPSVPLSPNAQALRDYRLPTTPSNETNSGLKEVSINDPSIQNMGRGASFGRAFQQGLMQGGIVHALESGVMGLVDPDYGKQAAVNVKNRQFYMQKQKEQDIQSRDPVLRDALQVATHEAELPGEIAKNQAYTQARVGGQLQVGAQKIAGTEAVHDADNRAKLQRLGATWDEKNNAKLNTRFNEMRAESVNDDLSDDEVRDKAAQGIALEQKAALAKTNAQTAHYNELTGAIGTRLKQTDQRISIALQNAQTNQARLAQSGANAQQRAQNESVVNQLKALGSHAASLRREHATQAEILNSMNTSPEQKDAAEKAIQGINKDLNDLDVQQRTITGAPARGAKGNAPPSVAGSAGGATHPNAGKAFKNPDDGKWYIADEIDAQGNITKYHPKP